MSLEPTIMPADTIQPRVLAAERLLGAGLVSGRNLGSQIGLALIACEQVGRIYGQQVAWFLEDHRTTLRSLARTMDPVSVGADHLGRRAGHVFVGLAQLADTAREIAERSMIAQQRLWDPFADATGLPRAPSPFARSRRGVVERLLDDHKRLSQILAVMERLLERPEQLRDNERHVVVSGIDYIAEYPDAVHHPLEDRLFRHLLETKLSDQELEHVLQNEAAHAELARATKQVLRDLDGIRGNHPASASALKSSLSEYIDLQRRHMRFEEQYVFPLADKYLPNEALQELGTAEEQPPDPLFDERGDRFDDLYYFVSGRL
jgi:hemerythrin-like domain-containing protein